MAEEVEVTTEGVREPPTNAPPRWTQAYGDWSDEESEWSSDASSFSSSLVHSIHKGQPRKRGLLLCLFTVLLAAIIAGLVVAIVIPTKNRKERSNNAAAASAGTDNDVSQSQPPTATPTLAPTTALGLPEACTPHYNNVDFCLENELTEEEANNCVDCVWDWLPANEQGSCQQTESIICNILSQCGCGPCATFLEDYLDCQTSCAFDCQLDAATERANGGE